MIEIKGTKMAMKNARNKKREIVWNDWETALKEGAIVIDALCKYDSLLLMDAIDVATQASRLGKPVIDVADALIERRARSDRQCLPDNSREQERSKARDAEEARLSEAMDDLTQTYRSILRGLAAQR